MKCAPTLINAVETGAAWVSDSPYLHVLDDLESVHHQMKEQMDEC